MIIFTILDFIFTTSVVLSQPVQCLVVSTTVASFFFMTFQIVVLAIPSVCAMPLTASDCLGLSLFSAAEWLACL